MSTGASGDRWQDFQTHQWCFPWWRHVVCLRVFNLMCVSVCFRSLLSPALSNTCHTLQHQNKVTHAHAHTHCAPSQAPHTDQTKWVTVTWTLKRSFEAPPQSEWGPKTSSRPRLVLTKTYVPLCTQDQLVLGVWWIHHRVPPAARLLQLVRRSIYHENQQITEPCVFLICNHGYIWVHFIWKSFYVAGSVVMRCCVPAMCESLDVSVLCWFSCFNTSVRAARGQKVKPRCS